MSRCPPGVATLCPPPATWGIVGSLLPKSPPHQLRGVAAFAFPHPKPSLWLIPPTRCVGSYFLIFGGFIRN